jgi:hypothetical protein
MRTVFMALSGQPIETVLERSRDHNTLVVPYAFARAHRGALPLDEMEVLLHVPACYGRPGEYVGDFYDAWYALANRRGAWFKDDDGRPVKVGEDSLFDLRRIGTELGRILGNRIAADFKGRVPDGLFLDCTWDSVRWLEASGYRWTDPARLDADWRRGLGLFLFSLRSRLALSGLRVMEFVGNGWLTCPTLDAVCIEGFPQDGWAATVDKVRAYGPKALWMLPRGAGTPGECVSRDDALAAYAFGRAFSDGYDVAVCVNDLNLLDGV